MKLPSRTVADQAAQYNFEKLERTVDAEPVTSLPTTDLYVGRRIVYVADSTNGVYWDLMLTDPNATYPWKYVGGPPLFNEVTTDQGTASATPVDLATAGPSLTNPLAGDWVVEIGANMYSTTAGSAQIMALQVAGVAPVNALAGILTGQPVADNTAHSSAQRTLRRTAIAASSTWVPKYWQLNGGTGQFRNRWITLRPIMVG